MRIERVYWLLWQPDYAALYQLRMELRDGVLVELSLERIAAARECGRSELSYTLYDDIIDGVSEKASIDDKLLHGEAAASAVLDEAARMLPRMILLAEHIEEEQEEDW